MPPGCIFTDLIQIYNSKLTIWNCRMNNILSLLGILFLALLLKEVLCFIFNKIKLLISKISLNKRSDELSKIPFLELTSNQQLKMILVDHYDYKTLYEYIKAISEINNIYFKAFYSKIVEPNNLQALIVNENMLAFILYQSSMVLLKANIDRCFVDLTCNHFLGAYIEAGKIEQSEKQRAFFLIYELQKLKMNNLLFGGSNYEKKLLYIVINFICNLGFDHHMKPDALQYETIKKIDSETGVQLSVADLIISTINYISITKAHKDGIENIVINDPVFQKAYKEVDFKELESSLL